MLLSFFQRPLMGLLLLCLVILPGCAAKSKYGEQTTNVKYYPQCYRPIGDLRNSEYTVAKNTAGGAVIGGVLGAAVGYLVTGKASGAVIGGAAGATAGGAAGYYKGKTEMEREDSARLSEYVTMINGDVSNLNRVTAASKVARQCYEKEFSAAVAEFKAKKITKEKFNERFTEIKSGMDEAARVVGLVSTESKKAAALYNQALEDEAKNLGVQRADLPQKPTATKKPVAKKKPKQLATEEGKKLEQMAETTNAMEVSVAEVAAEESLLKERLAAMQRQSDDLMTL